MHAGLKTSRGGWCHPLYARSKRATPPVAAFTPEEIAARRAAVELDTEKFLARIADREARIAVEGDTDMNHDNVEAAE